MNTLDYRSLLLAAVIYVGLSVCYAASPINAMQTVSQSLATDSTSGRVLTITRVKTPWYAPRFLVVRGFQKSVPEYQRISGLIRKAYVLTDGNAYFGGIYLWQSETDARNWFNKSWFDRVQKTYGVAGVVDHYSVGQITDVAPLPAPTGNYWTVLSLSDKAWSVPSGMTGLLRFVSIRTQGEQSGCVTYWQTKAHAQAFVNKYQATHMLFDTPVFLDNVSLSEPHAVSISH